MNHQGRDVWCEACQTTHVARPCQSCKAEIFFALSHNGRRGPYDVAVVNVKGPTVGWRVEDGVARKQSGGQAHESHFATCPHANQWRRSRPPVQGGGT